MSINVDENVEVDESIKSRPWMCDHPSFTHWDPIGSVIVLDGMGGRTELIHYLRQCKKCHANHDHWFDITIDPNNEGMIHV